MASTKNNFPLGFHFNFKKQIFPTFLPCPSILFKILQCNNMFSFLFFSFSFLFLSQKKIVSNINFSQQYHLKAIRITRSFTSLNCFTFKFKIVLNHNISNPQKLLDFCTIFASFFPSWKWLSIIETIEKLDNLSEARVAPAFQLMSWGFVCFHCFCVFDFLDLFSMSPHLLCVISLP